MSYSRWGSSYWYTYGSGTLTEDAFEICTVCSFTVKELQHDFNGCVAEAVRKCPESNKPDEDDIDELRVLMRRYLRDMATKQPGTLR